MYKIRLTSIWQAFYPRTHIFAECPKPLLLNHSKIMKHNFRYNELRR